MTLKDLVMAVTAPVDWAVSSNWSLSLVDPKFRDPAYGGVTDLGLFLRDPNASPETGILLPVESVEEQIASITDNQLMVGHLFYRYPQERGLVKSLSVSFYDDAKYRLSKMFQAWIDFAIPPTPKSALKPLSVIQRKVIFTRWDPAREKPVWQKSYFVFPNGALTYQATSQPELVRFQIELVVVREVSHV